MMITPMGTAVFETLAALVIGSLLLLTAWEIVQGAIERLSSGDSPTLTPLAFWGDADDIGW